MPPRAVDGRLKRYGGRAAAETGNRRQYGPVVKLPGGEFRMGIDDVGFPEDGEGLIRTVDRNPFYVDLYAVTNAEFLQFVRDTGDMTEAE